MRRALAVIASLGLGLGTIALATPAQAANLNITVDCSSSTTTNPSGFNDGDVIVFTVGGNCERADVGKGLISAQGDISITGTVNITQDAVSHWRYFWTAGAVTEVRVQTKNPITEGDPFQEDDVFFLGTNSSTSRYQFVSAAPSPNPDPNSGSTDATGSAPASVMQQFGLPASGNCEDGYSDSMNWSGVGNGGWGVSWAQWMNDGSGGVVCSRTVMYDTSTSKWVVN